MLLAGAAAVPLLLHLLRRRSRVRAEFPAARYLARAEREHSRSLRLRNLLLMLLRVGILLLLAFAAARPAARWSGWTGGRSPVALAVVVDNSLSTSVVENGQPVLASLRDTAQSILAGAGELDRVWIVTADGRVQGGSIASARTALAAIRPLAGAGDIGGAVRVAAVTASGAGGLPPRVVVLTDGQRTAWPSRVEVPGGVEYMVVAPGSAAPPNRGVVAATPRPAWWTPRGILTIAVHAEDTVAFRGALLEGSVPRTVARGSVVPGVPQSIRVAPTDTGWIAGHVEIDPDEMPGDDTRYFAVWVGEAPRVMVTAGAGPFVRSAVDVMKEEGRVAEGTGIRLMGAHEVEGSGPVFLTAPAHPSQVGAANQALARRGIPWRLGDARPPGRLSEAALGGAEVRQRFALVATSAAPIDTVASVDGEPWAIAGTTAAGRFVLVASALVPEATALPVRAGFVPWLSATLLARLAGGRGDVLNVSPGAVMRMPPWADSLLVEGEEARAIGDAEFVAPAAPGVHFFSRDGRRVGALVVNVEESESVLARMDGSEVAGLLGDRQVRLAHDEPRWRDALFAGRGTRSLVVPALMAALVLLTLELAATSIRARGVA